MLKVIPMSKADEHERVCLTLGLEYDKNQFAYAAYDDDEIVGASQFYIKDGIGYVTDQIVKDGNLPLAMLLGRSVLNFLDLHGVEEAYFEKGGDLYSKIAKIIGYKEKDGKFYAYLPGMFTADHHH